MALVTVGRAQGIVHCTVRTRSNTAVGRVRGASPGSADGPRQWLRG